MSESDLRRKLDYYRRHLDDLAAQRIVNEHDQWTHRVQLRQRQQAFQLLSRLALWFGTDTEPEALFRTAGASINSALEMDRTIIFTPAAASNQFVPTHTAGFAASDLVRLGQDPFDVPDMVIRADATLVSCSTPRSGLVEQVVARVGLDSFGIATVEGDQGTLGVIVTGRLGGQSSLYRPFDETDLDTLRAIAGVVRAIVQNRRIARLEETERLKSAFYADVAHEFRTPLTLTLGPLTQILDGKWGTVTDDVRQRLDVVARNHRRLLDLINEMLELARLDAGAAELRLEPVSDVNELVRECALHFVPAAEGRGLAFSVSPDPALAARPLLVDRPKLERALFNLISNALKFTASGRIDVTTRLTNEALLIAVADTGPGIDPRDAPHVFDRFRCTATNGKSRAPSSGIGLALVKEMVELHGGRVTLESGIGRGACFTLAIPIRDATAVPPSTTSVAPLVTDAETSNRLVEASFDPTKPIVLYAEDDPDLRAYVRDALRTHFNVFLAADGREGVQAAHRYRPDAIVTDQWMPNLDGHGLLRALRGDPELCTLPVLFLTAQRGTDGRVAGLDAGADDYVSKPFHQEELRARIAAMIRVRAAERELASANRRLQLQIREQMSALVRAGELERYLPREVRAAARRGHDTNIPETKRSIVVLVTELELLQDLGDRFDERTGAALVNDHLCEVQAICDARGGVIDGLATGRISVLFGAFADTQPEDTALAATETAFELQDAERRLAADLRRRGVRGTSRHGIGLSAGRALVGSFGGETMRVFAALSEACTQASQLHQASGAGTIRCDSEVYSHLGGRVRAREVDHDSRAFEITSLSAGGVRKAARPTPPDRAAIGGAKDRLLQREGEYWTVAYLGSVFRLRATKGVDYLAHLLARPHRQLHVLDLLAHAEGVPPVDPSAGADVDGVRAAGEHELHIPGLDDRARQAYCERIRDLQEVAEESRQLGNDERAARAESELFAVARELAAASGLGGRDRPAATAAERVRINVTRAIKATLGKVASLQPELGHHLAASVRTGMFCSYAPPPGAPDAWRIST